MTANVHSGWYLAAFASELDAEVVPLDIGTRRLVAVRGEDGGLRVYDADCPHRGAHLGHGGRLERGCLVCPFHGRRVGLGEPAGEGSRPWVREHEAIVCGDAVFVRLTDGPEDDRGLRATLKELSAAKPLVKAVERPVAAAADLIVENAFDTDHFTALHKVHRVRGMLHSMGAHGELVMDGEFPMPASPWGGQGAGRPAAAAPAYVPRFHARAFSPGVVVTEFGPSHEVHVIVTGAVPDGRGGCVARVAVGVGEGREDQLPMLIAGSERALAEDIAVWEHLNPRVTPRYDAADAAVVAYREFCAGFTDLDPREAP
ncbi:Phenylpropionate dioxygenase, large terminal subunit [Streptomyces sp. 1222.5]|uniref:Rieske 2Fe-2S domain-containing protein n=1 Tax=unclassified Streptomyces TaxID=2593676 RepID=UPI000894F860|nr:MULTISPECIES: Rieske 2Fe-2S domain-containing protein [unclassified Streptomyces]PKW09364.1 phenylpropionate dioxygenase-like ring-hydroxylating dioxygenase large terminal subunit [Streptomyces sp. 5112.2]SEC37224.1 Phenylpropionate dioxygenase, large terminal subunit [Streptomyces sp. 1222.5]SED53915.1 Phenylpropionate dioxygenase, large terminal subunit [Streptomyces sp. 2231.1]